MRVPGFVRRLAIAAVVSTVVSAPISTAVAAPAPSIAGSWKGPWVGTNFLFEFRQAGNGWAGRYRSDRSGKWADLQNVTFSGDTVRFGFQSTPPSILTLKIDRAGKVLKGSARIGPHPPLPLTLSRAS
jgi:hypothetical protein